MPKHLISSLAVLIVLWITPALAQMQQPSGPVLLKVTGAIDRTNVGDAAHFDRTMLEALDWRDIRTHTSFTVGEQVFAGPTIESLFDYVGAQGSAVIATAINDYSVEISIAQLIENDAFLAMDHGGRPMRVRDKGPIWIVFPLTEQAARLQPFDREMVWQLVSLHIGS